MFYLADSFYPISIMLTLLLKNYYLLIFINMIIGAQKGKEIVNCTEYLLYSNNK